MHKDKPLLLAATLNEVQTLLQKYPYKHLRANLVQTPSFLLGITGVGLVNTAISTTKLILECAPSVVIQAGIAGTFNESIQVGDTVRVIHDFMPELQAKIPGAYISMPELGLLENAGNAYTALGISNDSSLFSHLPPVRAVSVQTISGDAPEIENLKQRYFSMFGCLPDIETMEGAAFFTACSECQVPCVQIRSISNPIENRDKSRWDISKAIASLCSTLSAYLDGIHN